MEIPKENYLDTNMIWAWFGNMMKNIRKGESLKIPDILKFISSKAELKTFTTNLTKAEIFRYLKSEWGCDKGFSEDLWNKFLVSFNTSYIEFDVIEIDELIEICSKVATKKKTLVNLMHLQLAKKNNLWFLTGEENLKEKYKEYYDKVLTYEDLRGLFAKPNSHSS